MGDEWQGLGMLWVPRLGGKLQGLHVGEVWCDVVVEATGVDGWCVAVQVNVGDISCSKSCFRAEDVYLDTYNVSSLATSTR